MCARYIVDEPERFVRGVLKLSLPDGFGPRYNVAPTQTVLAARAGADGAIEVCGLRWGLIPGWHRDGGRPPVLFNARGETVAEKPAFRAAFKRRRCLIPAGGFYEWLTEGTGKAQRKRPHLIRLRDREPFAFAGLWDRWARPDGTAIESCSIVTTEANADIAPIHDRMPVILGRGDYVRWLDPESRTAAELIRPLPGGSLVLTEVSPLVNSSRCDSPQCIEPLTGLFDTQ